ncbi:MAG TPA: hypothetical protein VIY27_10480 [Myxococcota bacterium]
MQSGGLCTGIPSLRHRVRGARRCIASALVCSALACQGSYYDAYRARNPGWEAGLPQPGATLEAVLASLYAPTAVQGIRLGIEHLSIYRADVRPWREIGFDEIRKGRFRSEATATYAVTALHSCRASEGLREIRAQRSAYYLLPANRLESFDHYEFRTGCGQRNHFRAARGAAVALERELEARAAREYGPQELALDQLYRRGLAYVEVGRVADARAALVAAEPAYRAQAARARAAPGPEARRALAESERLRGNLMRALGVEPVGR